MAVRKGKQEAFLLDGDRGMWLERSKVALESEGFADIVVDQLLWQVRAKYRKLTVWGSISITLVPEGDATRLNVDVTSNVDNIYALFRSPGQKILDVFKEGLSQASANA